MPGWLVTNMDSLTVALDINISEELKEEGIAREFVNRIQNIRKDSGFDVTDKIAVKIQQHDEINNAIKNNLSYICTETLTSNLDIVDKIDDSSAVSIEIDDNIKTLISIQKN